jgi:hypothetical protein
LMFAGSARIAVQRDRVGCEASPRAIAFDLFLC